MWVPTYSYFLKHVDIRRYYCMYDICVCVCVCVRAQLCLSLYDPMDYSLPVSSVHVVSQVGILEWVAVFFTMESS